MRILIALAGLFFAAAVVKACDGFGCQKVQVPATYPLIPVRAPTAVAQPARCSGPSCYGQQATKQLAATIFQSQRCRPIIYKLCQTPLGAKAASDAIANAINGAARANADATATALRGDALALRCAWPTCRLPCCPACAVMGCRDDLPCCCPLAASHAHCSSRHLRPSCPAARPPPRPSVAMPRPSPSLSPPASWAMPRQ